jgi:hypothetical protein
LEEIVKASRRRIEGIFVIYICLILSFADVSHAEIFKGISRVEAPRSCGSSAGPLRGIFTIGTIGPTCSARGFGNALLANIHYDDFIVDESKISFQGGSRSLSDSANRHIVNYGVQITNLMDQMAYDFLKTRGVLEKNTRKGATISDAELKAWQLFIKVIAYQESLFTHYQLDAKSSDEDMRLRIMVGDQEFAKSCVKSKETGATQCKKRLDSKGRPIPKLDAYGNPIYQSRGMFQIMSSQESALAKKNFDLVNNIQNGMSHIYSHWRQIVRDAPESSALRAQFAKCRHQIHTSKGVNYEAAIRAAYGMYNGGPMQICRFANSDAKNAAYEKNSPGCKVDKLTYKSDAQKKSCEAKQRCGYYACPWVNDMRIKRLVVAPTWESRLKIKDSARAEKYKNKSTKQFEFNFDISCLLQGRNFCLRNQNLQQAAEDFMAGRTDDKLFELKSSDENGVLAATNYCVYEKNKKSFTCTQQEKLVPCLQNYHSFKLESVVQKRKVISAYYRVHELPFDINNFQVENINDPYTLCKGQKDGVFTPGEFVQALKPIIVYESKNLKSKQLFNLAVGAKIQILDLNIDAYEGEIRWYKVSGLGPNNTHVEGYFFAGDDYSWSEFLTPTPSISLADQVIPVAGDYLRMKNETFVFIGEEAWRMTPGAYFMQNQSLPAGAIIKVLEIKMVGYEQNILVKFEYSKGVIGYVKIGQLKTANDEVRKSINQVIEIIPKWPEIKTFSGVGFGAFGGIL